VGHLSVTILYGDEIELFKNVADLKEFLVIPGVVGEDADVEGCDGDGVAE
jgi:hypothetical protein